MNCLCWIKNRALKTYDKMEVWVYLILTLVPDVCK
jgi:hypothetical protein